MPHEIKVGDVYKTIEGKSARIICTDRRAPNYPVVALIEEGDAELLLAYTATGRVSLDCSPDCETNLVLPESYEDWEIDDPIWVWNDPSLTFPRHFAGVGPEGKVHAWRDGFTSHTISEQEPTSAWLFASKTCPATVE
jgi:hypothetical protein